MEKDQKKIRQTVFLTVISILVLALLAFAWYESQKSYYGPSKKSGQTPTTGQTTSETIEQKVDSTGYLQEGGEITKSDLFYTASSKNASAVLVRKGGKLTLDKIKISKTGDSSSSDESSFFGLNAAVLAKSSSTIMISNSAIEAKGKGANGAFANGSGSIISLQNSSVTASGDGAHAIMATQGGTVVLNKVSLITDKAHSGAIATDRGGGLIKADNGSVKTYGTDSPGIYSTGDIIVSDYDISAANSEAAVIEGSNNIILNNVNLSSALADKWGIMIYQSFSGDAQGSTGNFEMTGGSLTDSGANSPLFYVNNSIGLIKLAGVDIKTVSGIIAKAAANSRWGKSGSNGGNIQLLGTGQTLTGNIIADNISTVSLNLTSSSLLKGAINTDKTAKEASLSLDKSSHWEIAGDSYLTVLTDKDGLSGKTITNISGQGHNVYYNSSNTGNSYLGGKTYALTGGGELKPYK